MGQKLDCEEGKINRTLRSSCGLEDFVLDCMHHIQDRPVRSNSMTFHDNSVWDNDQRTRHS